MKAAGLIWTLFAAILLAFAPISLAEVSNLGSDQEFLRGDSVDSGAAGDAPQPVLNEFTFGFSGKNFCMTKTIMSGSEAEAMELARQSCENCRIYDLTGKADSEEAPFCQIELK